jgi:sec-independent protein translocase protein TatB
MFNVGGGELIVILMIALIVLGPKRLPDAARTIGKTLGDLRRLSTSFQSEVKSALSAADDLDQVASRRNPLGTDEPSTPAPHSPRTKPLVAAPDPGPAETPAKVARPAPRRAAPEPKNGTAVEKPAPANAPARRTKPS